jgi:hypothetical protein
MDNIIGISVHNRGDMQKIITKSYSSIDAMQVINTDLPLQSAAGMVSLFNIMLANCKCSFLSIRLYSGFL